MINAVRLFCLCLALSAGPLAYAQPETERDLEAERAPQEGAPANLDDQEHCITVMTGFPDTGYEARYHFFRLIEEVGRDATPAFRETIAEYGQNEIPAETPIAQIIEGIANPVLRQAAPHIPVAQTAHLIDFAHRCNRFISGQADSLEAYDPALSEPALKTVIGEDALFLRQVMTDALYRLGADRDPAHSEAVTLYARALIATRDDIEFTSFEEQMAEIEAIFMTDLDGRLARANDVINNEIDAEALASAISLSSDLNASARAQHELQMRENMWRILRIYQ